MIIGYLRIARLRGLEAGATYAVLGLGLGSAFALLGLNATDRFDRQTQTAFVVGLDHLEAQDRKSVV